jgi:hypothetical protein
MAPGKARAVAQGREFFQRALDPGFNPQSNREKAVKVPGI